jgi:mannose/cellobiose epimerase-like protein (N-acyl-D-glucosamine 2-epimerase family)
MEQFLWLQAREVWMFSKLYNEVETADEATKQTWLDMAKYETPSVRSHDTQAALGCSCKA